MQRYQVSLDTVQSIAIMRVENGFLIRTDDMARMGVETPLQVAERADTLAEIVKEWATARQAEGDEMKARRRRPEPMHPVAEGEVGMLHKVGD